MVGHTGFLVTARRLADGVSAPTRRRRPAGSTREGGEEVEQAWDEWTGATGSSGPQEAGGGAPDAVEWTPEQLGERAMSEKKIRRVRRDVTGTAFPTQGDVRP
jgi:tRNA (adenine57-N1/adenine58-N1)-methyltransferase